MPDLVDRRVLGALRCVDRATGFILLRSFNVSSQDATFIRNRSNLYVVKTVSGLEIHTDSFTEAPSVPVMGSILITVLVNDPLNKYLPRMIVMGLPRDPDPENTGNDNSLFNPVDVSMYAAPNATLMTNWSTVRVSVMRNDPVQGLIPVRGSLLRIVRISDTEVLSSGLSDERGEALVIVPGVPITQFADGEGNGNQGSETDNEETPVTVTELSVRLEISVDPNPDWPVNPDLLEANHAANLVANEPLSLRTGRMEKLTIELT